MNINQEKYIFISHAGEDKELIDAFIEMIEIGLGLTESKHIFYSSKQRLGVPPGVTFREYLINRIKDAEYGIALITPNYIASEYCIFEIGCHSGADIEILPIIVPQLSELFNYQVQNSDLPGVLDGIHALNIARGTDLDTVAKIIAARLVSNPIDIQKWNECRDKFLKNLPDVLNRIPPPSVYQHLAEKPIVVFYTPSLEPHSFYAEIAQYIVDAAKIKGLKLILEAGTLGRHKSIEHRDVINRYVSSPKTVIIMIPPNSESHLEIWRLFNNAAQKFKGWDNIARLITLDVPPDLRVMSNKEQFELCEAHRQIIKIDSNLGARMASEEIFKFCKHEALRSISVIICEGNLHGTPLNCRGEKFSAEITRMAEDNQVELENLWDNKVAIDFDKAFEGAHKYVNQILTTKTISNRNVFVFCANDNLAHGASRALEDFVRRESDPPRFKIICFDRSVLISKLIELKSGFFWRVIDQQPSIMATIAMTSAKEILEGQKFNPQERIIKSPPDLWPG